jgi:polyisoprenoid-binding protein YceI
VHLDDPTPGAPGPPAPSRTLPIVALVGAAVVVLLVGGLVWFLSGDEPDAVDLAAGAPSGPAEAGVGGGPGDGPRPQDIVGLGSAGAGAQLDDVTGVWVVDRDAQRFDRAAGAGSFVGYRIEEELVSVGATMAVGRSPEVGGELELDGTTVVAARITGDLTALESDDGRRDARVRSTFAGDGTASFELDEPLQIGAIPAPGEVVETTGRGTLTIEGVSREVTVALQATTRGERLVVAGATVMTLADFGVAVPTAPLVLGVSDEATLEWQLFLSRT